MRYYLVAGERSGDLHASNLMKAILKKDSDADFRYFGGDYMQAVGGTLMLHYRELAFMGFWEVLKNLRTINRFIKLCKEEIDNYQPNAIILVDYAGFNLKIAKYARRKGYTVFYYISPKVWAWNQKRALKIKARVNYMFAILPFEVEFYKKFDWHKVSYVGNPVVEAISQHRVNENFKNDYQIDPTIKNIAILPGSRRQELQHILPVLKTVIAENQEYHFSIAAVKTLPTRAYNEVAALDNTTLIFDDTYNLLAHADAAIVTSGTATLETALWQVPQIVVYRSSWLSYRIAKALVRVKYISLVNLIMGREVVKELLQNDCSASNITATLNELLQHGIDYSSLQDNLGNKIASEEAAKLMLEHLVTFNIPNH
jgi:lipid-A-disaccharide synthase